VFLPVVHPPWATENTLMFACTPQRQSMQGQVLTRPCDCHQGVCVLCPPLQMHHPSWRHMFWDAAASERLLAERYPWFLDTWHALGDSIILKAGESTNSPFHGGACWQHCQALGLDHPCLSHPHQVGHLHGLCLPLKPPCTARHHAGTPGPLAVMRHWLWQQ
jgi:hypothetical protein